MQHANLHCACLAEVQLDAAAAARAQNKRALHKRTSSGDWSQDRLTWQEQVGYKKAMGFL